MSGHSKWKNIMHKKEKTDLQRAKISQWYMTIYPLNENLQHLLKFYNLQHVIQDQLLKQQNLQHVINR